MVKKRLVGIVTVRQGLAVQSFGYRQYLPLGKPEVLIENLDRWGADEILVQCIDRSSAKAGPDLSLLRRIGSLGLSTPLIYGGGISRADDAVKVVSMGADRVLVDSVLWDEPRQLENISRELGTQAVIVNMPVRPLEKHLIWRNYRSQEEIQLIDCVLTRFDWNWVSEVMLTDWKNEGYSDSFDPRIPELFPLIKKPLIVFGGISEPDQLSDLLARPNVAAAAVGNFLSYKEHSIQQLKKQMAGIPIRAANYAGDA